jgi:hypothetical protein
MLDPLFDTNPIESIEELNIFIDPPKWIKVQAPSKELEDKLLKELSRQLDIAFDCADDTTVPYSPI